MSFFSTYTNNVVNYNDKSSFKYNLHSLIEKKLYKLNKQSIFIRIIKKINCCKMYVIYQNQNVVNGHMDSFVTII